MKRPSCHGYAHAHGRHDRFRSGIDLLRHLADPDGERFDKGIAEFMKSMNSTLAGGIR